MAAMAGYIDELMAQRYLAHSVSVVHLDAAVKSIPEVAQQAQHDLDGQLSGVREDLPAILQCPSLCPRIAIGLRGQLLLHQFIRDNFLCKLLVAGDLWAEGCLALLSEQVYQLLLHTLFVKIALFEQIAKIEWL